MSTTTLGDAIAYYLRKMDGALAPSTLKVTKSILKGFLAKVTEIAGIDPDTEDVDDILIIQAIKEKWPNNGVTATHSRVYGRIKTFVKWSSARGFQYGDLEKFLQRAPQAPDLDKKYAKREEVQKVVTIFLERGDVRDARLFELHFESHRRQGELKTLKIGDVDLKPTEKYPFGRYFFHQHKIAQGARKEIALLPREAEILKTWLKEYEEIIGRKLQDDWYLFPGRIGYGTNKTRKGDSRRKILIPERPIGDLWRVFNEGWKLAGCYERGKGGHANRRGGMEEAYKALIEAGVPDPLGVIMPRSGHKNRSMVAEYLNRREAEERSFNAYLKINRGGTNPPQTTQEETDVTEKVETPSNVISFTDLRNRRRIG